MHDTLTTEIANGTSSNNRAETNRENAKKSTGPRTEAGKQRCSLNALRHGLIGDEVVGWQDDGLASEPVTEGVEGAALFAGLGARARRFLSVFPIGFGAVIGGCSIRDFCS